MDEAPYTPIDCSLHDRLEAAATLRPRVLLRYDAGDGQVEENARIVDIRTRGGAEYLVLSSGTEVRLDWIVSLDGLPFRQQTAAPTSRRPGESDADSGGGRQRSETS